MFSYNCYCFLYVVGRSHRMLAQENCPGDVSVEGNKLVVRSESTSCSNNSKLVNDVTNSPTYVFVNFRYSFTQIFDR